MSGSLSWHRCLNWSSISPEEEVEFADRSRLLALVQEVLDQIDRLVSTYRAGKAFKEGVPVAIAGRPNAGSQPY